MSLVSKRLKASSETIDAARQGQDVASKRGLFLDRPETVTISDWYRCDRHLLASILDPSSLQVVEILLLPA
jgi:hypothetical protein